MKKQGPKRKTREAKKEKQSTKEQIPKLDPKTAQDILDRIFEACDWEKSQQTVEELERKGRYLKKAMSTPKKGQKLQKSRSVSRHRR